MTMPGFSAETSLYRTGIQYGSMQALVQASGVTPELFCRPTDCPCLYNQCRKAGGTVVRGPQPQCFYTCEAKPGCSCAAGETCCNPFTNFCCPAGETCCNPGTEFCCPSGHTCCSNTRKDACCPPGQLCCDQANNGCADVNTDPSNCGSCGKSCGAGNTCNNGRCTEITVTYQPPQPPLGPGFPGTLTIQGQNFASNVDVALTICNCDLTPFPITAHTSTSGSFTTTATCNCGGGGTGLACGGPLTITQAIVLVTAQDTSGNTESGSAANPC